MAAKSKVDQRTESPKWLALPCLQWHCCHRSKLATKQTPVVDDSVSFNNIHSRQHSPELYNVQFSVHTLRWEVFLAFVCPGFAECMWRNNAFQSDMYHMTVVIFSTLANGPLTPLKCANKQRNKQQSGPSFSVSQTQTWLHSDINSWHMSRKWHNIFILH